MATKKEEPIANDETGKIKVKAKTKKQPDGNETKESVTKVKEKMKLKPQVVEETITRVDVGKPTEEVVAEEPAAVEEVVETPVDETPVVEEITDEEIVEAEEQVEEAIAEAETTGDPLPENLQKLVDFMGETGGDINDYVKLNQDYDKLNDSDLLREFYNQTKPHLDTEEINFLMEDTFSYDEDIDDERDIRKKKIALKEQVASAKSHLDGQKSKYYEEIKMGSKLPNEAKKAMDFFNRYNKESEETKKISDAQRSTFNKKTDSLFNDKFKGFEYNVGDKKFRYNVKDVDSIKKSQSDSDNFFKKFLDKKNHLDNAKDFHKSLYTAMNPDQIANHFYEQGKSDAIKTSVGKGKNISMDPRQAHGEISTGGLKVRALGDTTADFKFKIKNNKFKN